MVIPGTRTSWRTIIANIVIFCLPTHTSPHRFKGRWIRVAEMVEHLLPLSVSTTSSKNTKIAIATNLG